MARNDNGNSVDPGQQTRTVYLEANLERLKAPRFDLLVQKGANKGENLSWEGLTLRVGAAPDNDLVLDDSTVSRHHFRIELDPRGYRLRDLDSKNGVIVQDIPVRDAYLPPSCRITVGDTVLKYKEGRETVDLELVKENRLGELLGASAQMRHLFALIRRVADTSATVLVEGDSGTGKELVAAAVHHGSERRDGPFVKVNCAALSESLLESELFGHVKGSFTGAVRDKVGRFELADGGTVFLDEIGDLSPQVQVKLLRVLQEREIERVGGTETIAVDCRIIAATNQDLLQAIAAGGFREDLYYRLNVMPIEVPPLRQRRDDIPLLVDHFVDLFRTRTGRPIRYVDDEALQLLTNYSWPGNVRQLQNVIRSVVVLNDGGAVTMEMLPAPLDEVPDAPVPQPSGINAIRPLAEVEREIIEHAIRLSGNKVPKAAHALGVSPSTLYRKKAIWEQVAS